MFRSRMVWSMCDRTRQPINLAVIAGAVAALAIPVHAARADYPEYVKTACKRDFKSFCPRYDINSTQLRQCMRSVAKQLSPRCTDALERSGEKRR